MEEFIKSKNLLIKPLGYPCQMTLKYYVRTYFFFAATMAPVSPDSATGDAPSFISLLDPRTGKVYYSGIHVYIFYPCFL